MGRCGNSALFQTASLSANRSAFCHTFPVRTPRLIASKLIYAILDD
jgi:hypothetical protein